MGTELGSLIRASTDTTAMIHDPAALVGAQRRELRPTEEVALQGSRDPKLHGTMRTGGAALFARCYKLTLQSDGGPRSSPLLRAGERARAPHRL